MEEATYFSPRPISGISYIFFFSSVILNLFPASRLKAIACYITRRKCFMFMMMKWKSKIAHMKKYFDRRIAESKNLKNSLGKGHSVLISPNSNSVEKLAHANSFHQYSSSHIIYQPERAVPITEREEKKIKMYLDSLYPLARLNAHIL